MRHSTLQMAQFFQLINGMWGDGRNLWERQLQIERDVKEVMTKCRRHVDADSNKLCGKRLLETNGDSLNIGKVLGDNEKLMAIF